MQLFKKNKHKPSINLTPLIDILFILIIFFVVSSKIIGETGIRLILPNSQQGKTTTSTIPILSITSNQELFLDEKKISKPELAAALQQLLKDHSKASLILNIDQKVPHGFVILIMDTAKTAGIQKIVFGTKPPQEK